MLAAWRRAAAQRDIVLLGKAANAPLLSCDFRYSFQEGEAVFRQAAESLGHRPNTNLYIILTVSPYLLHIYSL